MLVIDFKRIIIGQVTRENSCCCTGHATTPATRMSVEIERCDLMYCRILPSYFHREFSIPLVWFMDEVLWVITRSCPSVKGAGFACHLESVNAHVKWRIEARNHLTKSTGNGICSLVDVVDSSIPVFFFTWIKGIFNCSFSVHDVGMIG